MTKPMMDLRALDQQHHDAGLSNGFYHGTAGYRRIAAAAPARTLRGRRQ